MESRLNKRFPRMGILIPLSVALIGLAVAEYPNRPKNFQANDGSIIADNPPESIMRVQNTDGALKEIFSYDKKDTLLYVDSLGNQYTITGDSLSEFLADKREKFAQYKNERGWF